MTLSNEQREALEKLREPFDGTDVDKLPRIACPNCRKADGKVCNEHKKTRCEECGQYITERHIHLDYVGHAAITDRLLDVDLEWNWLPLASDERGSPIVDVDEKGRPVGLWINLTVAGMTRLGYGTVESNKSEPMKELIGDALRNAGMRFGMALYLWKKHSDSEAAETKTRGTKPTQPSNAPAVGKTTSAALVARLFAVMRKRKCGEPFVKELAHSKWADFPAKGSLSKLGNDRVEELASFIERADDKTIGDLAVKLMGETAPQPSAAAAS